MIFARTAADPIQRVPVTGNRTILPFLEKENEGPVREVFADSEGVDCPDSFDAEATRSTLLGERTVDEAIG